MKFVDIKNAENLDLIPESLKDEGFKYAYEEANKHNWSKAELEAYDYVLMREQDDRGRLTKVQKDIAKRLIKLGMQDLEIATATELNIEQIEKLRTESKI